MLKEITTHSELETQELSHNIATEIQDGDVLCLFGEVGAGKTVFTQGVCKALGYNGYVNSPSYIILNEYPLENLCIYHYDLYRMQSIEELNDIGLYDFVGKKGTLSIIEWAEMLGSELPLPRLEIHINNISATERKFKIKRYN